MPSSFSRSPLLLKGAFIQIPDALVVPIPNIVLFQYNSEKLSRNLEIWAPSPPSADPESDPVPQSEQYALDAQPGDPRETLTLTLELDAADALEEPTLNPVAVVSGIADRLAALEMLLYPQGDSGLGGLVQSAIDSLGLFGGGADSAAERKKVAPVFFTWGPGKIVPVRITSFSVEEQAFSPTLYPIRATVNVGMKILFESDVSDSSLSINKKLIGASYKFYKKQKQVLAAANISNNGQSTLGMLPF